MRGDKIMGESPFIKFYPSDFLAGTSGLSPAERGVYITLLCLIYEADGPIERHDARLSRRCGSPKAAFQRTLEALIDEGKIVEADGMLSNRRAEKAIVDRQNRSQIGTHAAQQRWTAQGEKIQQNQRQDDARAMPEQCTSDASQKPEPDIRTDTVVSVTRAKPKSRKSRISDDAEITDAMMRAADKRGHSQQEAEAQFQRFKNDALAKAKTFADWDRAFITWLDSPYFKPITTKGQTHGKRDGEAAEFARKAGERWAARFMDSGQDQDALGPLFPAGQPLRIGGSGD
jgi:uncharacterized protein YdaU (DUF1376 family)